MERILLWNGKPVPITDLHYGEIDRGFRYGDGAWESIYCEQGVAPLLEEHYDRLLRVLDYLAIDRPEDLTLNVLTSAIADQWSADPKRLHLIIWRAGAGRYTPEGRGNHFLMEWTDLDGRGACEPDSLEDIAIAEQCYIHSPLPGKLLSSAQYVRAAHTCHQRGYMDMLLTDPEGLVCESTNSAIIGWIENTLILPHTGHAGIDSVGFRALQGAADPAWHWEEEPWTPQLCERLESLYLVNAIRGVRWVEQIEGRSLRPGCYSDLHALWTEIMTP